MAVHTLPALDNLRDVIRRWKRVVKMPTPAGIEKRDPFAAIDGPGTLAITERARVDGMLEYGHIGLNPDINMWRYRAYARGRLIWTAWIRAENRDEALDFGNNEVKKLWSKLGLDVNDAVSAAVLAI